MCQVLHLGLSRPTSSSGLCQLGAESRVQERATRPAPALPSSVLSRMLRMSASSSVSSSGCWATYGCTHWTWGQSEGREGGRWHILLTHHRPAPTQHTLDTALQ